MQTNLQLQVILEVPQVRLYEIRGETQKFIDEGSLSIFESEVHNLVFIKLKKFEYPLQKNIPIIKQIIQQNMKIYIFPGLKDLFYGITIHIQQGVSDVFEHILSVKGQLLEPNPQVNLDKSIYGKNISQKQQMERSGLTLVNVNMWENVGQGEKSKGIGEYLKEGGTLIRDGLIATAEVISDGIKKGGHYIAGQIENKEEKPVDPATLKKVQMANTGAKALVTFTKAQLEALISFGKVVGEEASKQFAESETGQKIQQYKYYEEIKSVGTGAIVAFVSIYDGLYEALATICKGAAGATTEIVQNKYGDQAGQLSDQGFQLAGNVGQFVRVYEDTAAKAILQNQQNQQQQIQQQQKQ